MAKTKKFSGAGSGEIEESGSKKQQENGINRLDLTEENKKCIDSWPYEELLWLWRFSPVGDPMFQGETGDYYANRMALLEKQGADRIKTSKRMGWKK